MSEFLISQERISQATNIIVQFLRDSGYAGSLEDGTGLNDVVIKPSAVIYSLLAQMVDKAEVKEVAVRKASAMLGRPVTVKVVNRQEQRSKSKQMEQLLQFGREHSDLVNIKNS